jgi:uncharacterized HAD superfamily protein
LCFLPDKGDVGCNLYVEDTPAVIEELASNLDNRVIVFSNSANKERTDLEDLENVQRANSWEEVYDLVMKHLEKWEQKHTT